MARLAVLLAVVGLAACGGSSEEEAPPAAGSAPTTTIADSAPTSTEEELESATTGEQVSTLPGLPAFTAGYESWEELAKGLPPRDSDPHLGRKNVFATKRPSGGAFPNGTIIVKEGFRPGDDFVGLIATMRKLVGADPDHNDWVFVEYTRERTDDAFAEIARDAVCWSCHMGAAKTDYVFVLGDTLP
ncbi:MAG TPA: cytochrome P460 family protein [Gaiellaceae bacterium]|nr:cytochrome P460 family protein [Gaiellaceae bacterium]